MVSRQSVIEKAREFIGCPYHHQGRVKAGIDCAGLIICVAQELGLSDFDVNGYSPQANGVSLLKEFNEQCTPVDVPLPGDILIFRIRHFPQHCGIRSQIGNYETVIHAYQSLNAVKEHILHDWWSKRIVAAYKFPGVE